VCVYIGVSRVNNCPLFLFVEEAKKKRLKKENYLTRHKKKKNMKWN
jgi:hypothetical protein